MRIGYLRGLTAGAVIGAVAGMVFMPQVDRGSKRKIKRSVKAMRDVAGDAYQDMRSWMR